MEPTTSRVTEPSPGDGSRTPRRVFLDVGGNTGQSVRAALDHRWGFDRVWTFEPTRRCIALLERIVDDRLTVVPAGWWSADTEMVVHDPGAIGASVDPRRSRTDETERCSFIDAARWMAENIEPDHLVWLKINIEGAEIEVLDRLLTSGQISKVKHLVVHFDIEKVGELDKAEAMRRRLDEAGVPWREAKTVMFGPTDTYKLNTWLAWTHRLHRELARQKLQYRLRRRLYFAREWLRRRLQK
jgi:FkbM family methyltransferase